MGVKVLDCVVSTYAMFLFSEESAGWDSCPF